MEQISNMNDNPSSTRKPVMNPSIQMQKAKKIVEPLQVPEMPVEKPSVQTSQIPTEQPKKKNKFWLGFIIGFFSGIIVAAFFYYLFFM